MGANSNDVLHINTGSDRKKVFSHKQLLPTHKKIGEPLPWTMSQAQLWMPTWSSRPGHLRSSGFGNKHTCAQQFLEQAALGHKVVECSWIDVNKGDFVNKDYRSGIVWKECKDSGDPEIFAGTPPFGRPHVCYFKRCHDVAGLQGQDEHYDQR